MFQIFMFSKSVKAVLHKKNRSLSFMKKILLLLFAVLLLQQAALAQNTWTGSTSTDWSTGTNWSTGLVPSASDNVVIAATANQPEISTAAVAKTVEVQNGAILTIKNTGSL